MIPAVPVVLAAVAAGSGFLLWRFWNKAPVGVAIQYPLDSKIAYTLTNDQMDAVEQAQKALADGDPAIRTPYLGLADGELEVGCAMLKDDEVDVLVRRIGEVLAPRG